MRDKEPGKRHPILTDIDRFTKAFELINEGTKLPDFNETMKHADECDKHKPTADYRLTDGDLDILIKGFGMISLSYKQDKNDEFGMLSLPLSILVPLFIEIHNLKADSRALQAKLQAQETIPLPETWRA